MSWRPRPTRRRWTTIVLAALTAGTLVAPQTAGATPPPAAAGAPAIVPLDPQNWDNQYDLTWDDFVPVPGTDWSDPARQPSVKRWKAALVVLDYPNMPFQISQAPGSTVFGNPNSATCSASATTTTARSRYPRSEPSPANGTC
ncbi:hypothetical protein [Micromonospora sp. NPDC007230]|uniref:hypothetical protein n=1 Tax=Micromonospora sp. NPDC007230 TaxID=3364237 RepID=UPI0036831FE1